MCLPLLESDCTISTFGEPSDICDLDRENEDDEEEGVDMNANGYKRRWTKGEGITNGRSASKCNHSIIVDFAGRYNKTGQRKAESAEWSSKKVGDHHSKSELILDADAIADMIDLLLDNSVIQFRGLFVLQLLGIPMGTPCAPQIANLYCAFYELCFMQRGLLHKNHS